MIPSGCVAIIGNPNSGKTTLFNALTGANEQIGNWAGTTVELKEGFLIHSKKKIKLVDLPGVYSLSAHSPDEAISRDFIFVQKPEAVVVVVDALNLERNLYLVIQLLEMGQNVLVVLNKMDLARNRHLSIESSRLSELLNAPVIETTASEASGVKLLSGQIIEHLNRKGPPLVIDYGSAEEIIFKIGEFIEKNQLAPAGISSRAVAIRLLKNDWALVPEATIERQTAEVLKSLLSESSKNFGQEYEGLIMKKKTGYLKALVQACRPSPGLSISTVQITGSDKIDRVVTHPLWGMPIFFLMMYLLFSLVFHVGDFFADGIRHLFLNAGDVAAAWVLRWGWPDWTGSFISHGLFSGLGGVLVFLPYIMLLYFGISLLEDSGYLTRAAFIMDRFMRKVGLPGKAFIPMLLGFGCNIPGMMAARTLPSSKDRILTILVLPLMSCSARLPVYTLFSAALFPRHQGLVVFSLYVLGILAAMFMIWLLRRFLIDGKSSDLVMELAPYRLPALKHVLMQMGRQAWFFVYKAGTVILIFVILAWALASLPVGVSYASEHSIIGRLGRWIEPLFAPAGFGFWQAAVALFFGVMAKEAVIGTLGTLYGVEHEALSVVLRQYFTPLSGYAYLVMMALYIPCIASIVTIRREAGLKWALLAVFYTFILGWVVSVLIYQIGRLFF